MPLVIPVWDALAMLRHDWNATTTIAVIQRKSPCTCHVIFQFPSDICQFVNEWIKSMCCSLYACRLYSVTCYLRRVSFRTCFKQLVIYSSSLVPNMTLTAFATRASCRPCHWWIIGRLDGCPYIWEAVMEEGVTKWSITWMTELVHNEFNRRKINRHAEVSPSL